MTDSYFPILVQYTDDESTAIALTQYDLAFDRKFEVIATNVPIMSVNFWKLLTDVPTKNGRYIVGHRGKIFGNAYYIVDEGEMLYPVGWSQIPDMHPTHWYDGPYIDEPIGTMYSDELRALWPSDKPKIKSKSFFERLFNI